MIPQGLRRVFVMTELLVAIIAISVISIYTRPDMAGVLTVAVGAVGTLGAAYFGADGYAKGKAANQNDVKS